MGCRICRARKVQFSSCRNIRPEILQILHILTLSSLGLSQVKCDGRPNGCRNCERLQLDCVGDDGTPSSKKPSAASLRKIRTYRSCTTCRLSKTKCDGDRPICGRCSAKHIDCIYDGGAAPRWTRNFDRASHAPSVDSGISDTRESTATSGEREDGNKLPIERRIPPRPAGSSTATSDAGGDQNGKNGAEDGSYISEAHSWYEMFGLILWWF